MKSKTFKEYIQPVVVLVAICLVMTFALAYVNSITAPIIEQNAIETANAARAELLPAADTFTEFKDKDKLVELDPGKVVVTECYIADNGSGMVVTVDTKSFGGILTEMVGIDNTGAITGVKVISHADTKGLGTKAHDSKYLEQQYKGKTELAAADNIKGDPAVNHVSGATISSNAVYQGVCAALEQYKTMGGAN